MNKMVFILKQGSAIVYNVLRSMTSVFIRGCGIHHLRINSSPPVVRVSIGSDNGLPPIRHQAII